MAKSITVSVPDGLAEKIVLHRDRLSLSRLFADAVTKEIRKLEDVPKIVDDLEATITRLRESKAGVEQEDHTEGFKDGVQWATEDADYPRLKHWGGAPNAPSFDQLPESVREMLETWDQGRMAEGLRPIEFVAWARGWLYGVQSVWKEVQDKL
jgi:hypothetical protein